MLPLASPPTVLCKTREVSLRRFSHCLGKGQAMERTGTSAHVLPEHTIAFHYIDWTHFFSCMTYRTQLRETFVVYVGAVSEMEIREKNPFSLERTTCYNVL